MRRRYALKLGAAGVAGFVLPGCVEAQDRGLGKLLRGATRSLGEAARDVDPRLGRRDPLEPVGHVTRTADGWKLVAERYRGARPGLMPVLLCHGFGYNAKFFDLTSQVSLARHLAQQGFDVWAVNLRGCGRSNKWALTAPAAGDALIGRAVGNLTQTIPPQGYVNIDPKYAKWDLDDHIHQDVPTWINYVREQTRASQVAWLGHSMGGNVALAYLAGPARSDPAKAAAIGRLVTVGSQVTMPDGQLFVQFLLEMLRLRQGELAGRAPDATQALAAANNVFYNQDNVDPQVVRALLTVGRDTPALGLAQQYLILGEKGRLLDRHKRTDYSAGIGAIRCPCLFVGGSMDQIAPPTVQRHLYDNVAATDKTLLILGRRQGFRADYGHNDSLVGLAAPQEVYPRLARWLMGQGT